jgi:hypothetical protein
MKQYIVTGVFVFSSVFLVGMELSSKDKNLMNNYVQCTRALGVYAQEGNKEGFEHAWCFHKAVREYELNCYVAKKDQKTSQLDTAIEWYKKAYDSEENIKKHIDKLTVEMFKKKDGEMLLLLCKGRKLAVPHVKTKELFESLWIIQNADLVFRYHETYGYGDKQKTREWVIKHCEKSDFIEALIKNNYI